MTVRRRVLALISTLALSGEAVSHRGREGLELLACVAIDAEVTALGRRRAVPRTRAGRRHAHLETALLERALEQRAGEWAAANVAGADEQDVLDHGARRPTARRSSCTLNVPSRTICARGLVQSTTVEGGRFPNTPPSSTRSFPAATARAKSRAMASAPGPGGWPGRFADVDVNGPPSAATSRAIA